LSACRESRLVFALTPFRIGDCIKVIEVIESADKPGTRVQVRNSLFFQKTVRRWRNGEPPSARKLEI
jgi:hypothetical protein